ncbi:hypothetical protein HRbin06_00141 [archaeon HR06]|nr:hypothetical protein HRbin06_00141 [archaeon HR06]
MGEEGFEVKIKLPSGEVDAIELPFESSKEEWNEYKVSDGTIIKVKTIVTKIYRLKDKYNEFGEPIYHVISGNVITALVPPKLRKYRSGGEESGK